MKHFLRLKYILIIIFSIGFLISATAVLADEFGLDITAGAAGLNDYDESLPSLAGNVIGAGLSMVGVLFFILMVYGGIVWMTARGNEEHTKKALNTIIAACIGIVIVLASYAITSFVLSSVKTSAPIIPTTEECPEDCLGANDCTADEGTVDTSYTCPDDPNGECCL